jgi:multidrug efflux pump subunit AcrB
MKSIIKYFIQNEIAGNLLMFFLFIIGVIGLTRMKTTFFPEVESRFISIRCVYPGASPEEIEEGVITKIEEGLKGLTGVERVTSTSSENSGSVNVEILKSYDIDVAVQDVKNAVDRINSFPISMEPITVYKQENLGRAISFALSGDVELTTLKAVSQKVENELLATEGISKVTVTGFPAEEIEISFKEEMLRSKNISFAEAANAVRNYNLEITGGTIKTEGEELLVRASNKKYNAKELLDVVVRSNRDGGVVKLSELATITDQWVDVPTRTYLNGKPSVIVQVNNTLQEDMLTVTDKVKEYLEDYNSKNDVIKADIVQDASITLRQRIQLLVDNGIIGFVLVLVFLAMFLNVRLAFWVALSIPISFAGMFMVCSLLGITINVISLFGMILVIGILVDDGIVISENIYQRYEKGEDAITAATEGSSEVISAVVSAIVTTVIAFSAFFFLDGRIGDIFREMAVVVIFSLIFSLIEGIFILPAHIAHSKALANAGQKNKFNESLDKVMIGMRNNFYKPVMKICIRYPFPTLFTCVVFFFLTIGAFNGGFIKTTFFPNLPRDNFNVDLKLPAGTREGLTREIIDRIEKIALEVNDSLANVYYGGEYKPIVNMQKTIGPATNVATIDMTLLDGEKRGDLDARAIMNEIRNKVGPIYEAETFSMFSGSPFGKPVSISLLGSNTVELNKAVQDMKEELKKIPDLKDINDNNQSGLKEVSVTLKPEAYNLGFNLRDVISQVRQGFFGTEVQRLQRGKDEVRVWVRYEEADRSGLEDLSQMLITNTNGVTSPLSSIADFSIERGVINIFHIDGKREVRIEADVATDNVSVTEVSGDIKSTLVPAVLKKYPSVSVGYEGQEKEQAKTAASVKIVMPIILLLMFFTVILTFKSYSQAMVLFAIIPFGLIGVAFGHYVVGLPLSFFSALGIIALIGIMINDGLVFITAFNDNIRSNMPFLESIQEAALSRFRPIFLTSVTTIAGLMPLVLERSLQAQFLIPMAISVAFGILFSTVLILIMIPSLLVIVNRIKRYSLQIWENTEISPESVEPAYAARVSNTPIFLFAAITMLGGFALVIFLGMKISSIFI